MEFSNTRKNKTEAPYHLEAEKSVLGAIFLKSVMLPQLIEIGLEFRDFYVDAHQKIFEVILGLFEKGIPIDLITVSSKLRDKGWLDLIGGSASLTDLFEHHFSPGNALFYAELIREKAIIRKVIEVTTEITNQALQGCNS